MMGHIHKCLALPPEQRLGVMTLGTIQAANKDGMFDVPVNLLPIHLVGAAQVVDFRVTPEGQVHWLPYEMRGTPPGGVIP